MASAISSRQSARCAAAVRPAAFSAHKRRAVSVIQGDTDAKPFVAPPQLLRPQQWGQEQHPVRAEAASGDSQENLPMTHPDKMILGSPVKTWKKILPLGAMFFCILFNYTILRDTKDALVVTAPGSGAEIIPFLKTWVNLPLAMVFTAVYNQLANHLSIYQLFYGLIITFITFFGAFAFLIYPNANALHPTEFCRDLLGKVGDRWFAPIAIVQNWTYCLFYVMAELWGSVVISVLFWGFANAICVVKEAQQFYSLFGLVGNVALIFSGQTIRHFSNVRAKVPKGVDGWGVTLRGIMSIVVVLGVVMLALREYVERTTVRSNKAELPTSSKKEKKDKPKMGMGESFKFILDSTYIRCIAVLVIAYGISINIVEVTWKSKLKQQYPDPNDYSQFMGNFSTVTGATTFTLMLVARVILQKKSWGFAASIPPIVLGITGILFFSLILFGGAIDPVLAGMSMTPLFAAVMVGGAQNVFSKGSKYSLFDPCKEMAYIPLDDELKTKGKAAVDVIGNPLGKSGGALIQQVLIVGFGSLAASTPYLGIILLGVIVAWLKAVQVLSVMFEEEQAKREREDKQLEGGGGDAPAAA